MLRAEIDFDEERTLPVTNGRADYALFWKVSVTYRVSWLWQSAFTFRRQRQSL